MKPLSGKQESSEASGDFVKHAYDDPYTYGDFGYDDEVAYAADKTKLGGAVTAMIFHISHKLGKSLHDVTDNDIRNHGLIIKIHDGDQDAKHKPNRNDGMLSNEPGDYDYKEYPRGVEPGDYYFNHLHGDEFIKGTALLRFLKRLGKWPRNWGPNNLKSDNHKKGHLTNLVLKRHPNKSKQDVLAKIHSLNSSELDRHLTNYQKTPAIQAQV